MAEQAFPATPQSFGAARVVATPFQFALTEDDNLQIVSANSLAGVVLAVQGRKLSTNGKIEPFAFTHTPNSDRTTKTQNYKLGAGALLNLTIFASNGSPMIGQTFVSARMIRGLSAATILLGGLLGGYVTNAQPLAYPGSPIESSIEGGGYVRGITGTAPAAGVDFSETCPTGARWQLLCLNTGFTTSAAAGNRRPVLFLQCGGSQKAVLPDPANIAANNGVTFTWAPAFPALDIGPGTYALLPLPRETLLLAGDAFFAQTVGLQAGDAWTAPRYVIREWLEVQS